MPIAAFHKYDTFVEATMEKKHDLSADALVIALSNTAQSASFTTLANVVEIAYTNLTNLAGRTLANKVSGQTGGVYKLTADDVTIAASGGSGAAFQYVVLYNSTAAAGWQLIGWWDNGTPVTLTTGQSFAVDFDPSAGIITNTGPV